ncbi:hypothetical protein Bca52824_050265 [Brassica carinata]|uniref:Uncharacterized protein n=1 Tax=Brassica carinata TaxID=52824 RepID=A0A8X7UW18_BRACI|nr:hypothetical protein Bca52824_050265 [Brassica carinata]
MGLDRFHSLGDGVLNWQLHGSLVGVDLRWPESGSGSIKETLPSWFISVHGEEDELGGMVPMLRGYRVGLLCNLAVHCGRSGLVISCLKASAKGYVAAFGVRGECFGREDIARLRLGHMASLRNWLCEPDGAMHAGLGARGGCGSDKEAKQKSEAME